MDKLFKCTVITGNKSELYLVTSSEESIPEEIFSEFKKHLGEKTNSTYEFTEIKEDTQKLLWNLLLRNKIIQQNKVTL